MVPAGRGDGASDGSGVADEDFFFLEVEERGDASIGVDGIGNRKARKEYTPGGKRAGGQHRGMRIDRLCATDGRTLPPCQSLHHKKEKNGL